MHTQEQTNPMKGLGDMSDWLPRAPIKNGYRVQRHGMGLIVVDSSKHCQTVPGFAISSLTFFSIVLHRT